VLCEFLTRVFEKAKHMTRVGPGQPTSPLYVFTFSLHHLLLLSFSIFYFLLFPFLTDFIYFLAFPSLPSLPEYSQSVSRLDVVGSN